MGCWREPDPWCGVPWPLQIFATIIVPLTFGLGLGFIIGCYLTLKLQGKGDVDG